MFIISENSTYVWSYFKGWLPYIPKIIKFFGDVPDIFPQSTLGEKIVTYRTVLGLTQKELAKQLGIDPSTLAKWERDECLPKEPLLLEKLEEYVTV